MKRLILSLIALSASTGLFSENFFSGESGITSVLLNKDARTVNPSLTFGGYFGGQVNLSNALSVRGEFSLKTADMNGNDFLSETESLFRISELSANLAGSLGGAIHTLSLYLGFFEAPGSQKFISRRLGVENFSSLITETYLGQNGNYTCSNYGYGGAYSITFRSIPLSAGLEISKLKSNFEGSSQINTDFRLAVAFRYFTMDLFTGFGAPLYTKNSNGEDVFLLIDTIYLHLGADILWGNRYGALTIFNQFGFEYLPIKSTGTSKKFDIKDLYLLVEPRFRFTDINFYLTLFSLPEGRQNRMLFVNDTFGFNLCIFSDNLYSGDKNYTLGINGQLSFEGKHINNLEASNLTESKEITIAPFTKFEAGKGELLLLMQAGIMKIKDNKAGAFKLQIGYKKNL